MFYHSIADEFVFGKRYKSLPFQESAIFAQEQFSTHEQNFVLQNHVVCARLSANGKEEKMHRMINTAIIQHIVALPKYGHGELHMRRPHITDILQERQTTNDAVLYLTLRRQPSLPLGIVMISAKTIAYLSVYELAN